MPDDKQRYFEYDPAQGEGWWVKDPPTLDPAFQQGLNDLAGFSDRGQPVLRCVWGGTAMSDITHKPSLKYKAVREWIKGYNYLKTDGEIGYTKSMNLAVDAAEPWQFMPDTKRIEVGRLRWAVEMHVPAAELWRLGRFQKVTAPDGERVLRDLPDEGVYDHFFWIQTKDHLYRDADPQVLTAVQAMYVYNISTSEAQKALDAIEQEQTQTLVGAEEANAIWQGMNKS